MPNWFDSPGEIMAVLSILGLIVSVFVFIIDARVNRMYKEMRPNGGASLRDAIDRIEKKVDGHIEWHMDQK